VPDDDKVLTRKKDKILILKKEINRKKMFIYLSFLTNIANSGLIIKKLRDGNNRKINRDACTNKLEDFRTSYSIPRGSK